MSTLEPLQYFVGAVIVGLVLCVWGLWTACGRLIKQRDRAAYEADYERERADAFARRLDELTRKVDRAGTAVWRESVLSQYGERQTGTK